MHTKKTLQLLSWILALGVTLLAFIVWASQRFDRGGLTIYDYFPLLGLLAFSLMWTHYIVGSARRYLGLDTKQNKTYFKFTSIVVLFLILLHPGILIAGLYKDGFGLPPSSYLTVYSEPAMKTAIMLGSISLIIFLAFEARSKYGQRLWWKYIDYMQILAMILIFYHGLTLGRELSVEWYKGVWYFYGISFILAVIFNAWYDRKNERN